MSLIRVFNQWKSQGLMDEAHAGTWGQCGGSLYWINLLGFEKEQHSYSISSQRKKSEGSLPPNSLTSLSCTSTKTSPNTIRNTPGLVQVKMQSPQKSPGPLWCVQCCAPQPALDTEDTGGDQPSAHSSLNILIEDFF